MKCKIGVSWDCSIDYASITAAMRCVPGGVGYLWVFHRNHWHVVGSYEDGVMYNGPGARDVLASVEDLAWAARH